MPTACPDTETGVREPGREAGPALMFDEAALDRTLAERTQRIMVSVYRKRKVGRVLPFLGKLNREETRIVRGALRHAFAENQVVVKWLVDMVEDGMRRYGMTWED